MYESLLIRLGLSPDESAVYEALLQHGPQGAAGLLAKLKAIKRGLLYKVLDRLVTRGIVVQTEKQGKALFTPQPPDTLLALLEEQEREHQKSKEALVQALPELKAKYHLSTERPILRFFEGVDGLRQIFEDKLESGAKELLFIRTARAESYRESFGKWFGHYLKRQKDAGIRVQSLTVDDEFSNHDPKVDAARNVIRTWLRPEDYTAPIEIDTYGNKIVIVSFGKEIFGIMIESEPIARAMREILQLADRGARTLEVAHDHPPVKKQSLDDLRASKRS